MALAEAQQELGLPITDEQLDEMRAYVDNIRFTERAPADLVAGFLVETDPVVAGQPTSFLDETSCLLPDPADCPDPTSFRWRFGTRALPTPPDATGNANLE